MQKLYKIYFCKHVLISAAKRLQEQMEGSRIPLQIITDPGQGRPNYSGSIRIKNAVIQDDEIRL
jgi:hypothetical protein